jgi:hypothetical protein
MPLQGSLSIERMAKRLRLSVAELFLFDRNAG